MDHKWDQNNSQMQQNKQQILQLRVKHLEFVIWSPRLKCSRVTPTPPCYLCILGFSSSKHHSTHVALLRWWLTVLTAPIFCGLHCNWGFTFPTSHSSLSAGTPALPHRAWPLLLSWTPLILHHSCFQSQFHLADTTMPSSAASSKCSLACLDHSYIYFCVLNPGKCFGGGSNELL